VPERYFPDYELSAPPSESLAEADRIQDHGGHELSFSHLSDRTFEVLAWRLKREAFGPDRVRLMQGTGERGRDVVVYNNDRVETVVQCKLLRARMSKPEVVRELLKLALYDSLDPDILGDGPVRYELWAPGGFAELGEDLIRQWPRSWTPEIVEGEFSGVRSAFAAFSDLTWEGVREHVMNTFSNKLQPVTVGAHDVTAMTRAAPGVLEDFFVIYRAILPDQLRSILREEGLRHITDRDVQYLVNRIEAVSPERRHGTGFGFLLGVPEPLLSAMNGSEFRILLENSMTAAHRTMSLLIGIAGRCIAQWVFGDAQIIHAVERKTALMVLQATLVRDVLNSMSRHTLSGESAIDAKYRIPESLDLWGQIGYVAGSYWDDLSIVIEAGAPEGTDATQSGGMESEDAFRYLLSVHSFGEYDNPDRETFIAEVLRDLRGVSDAVVELAERVDGLVPEDVIVVSDLRLFDAPPETMTRFYDLYQAALTDRPSDGN